MAGGIGARFWPASREQRPKQFLDIMGVGKSLIRLTFERFLHLVPAENIFIVTNGMYKDLVKEHLPELTDNQILCEPSRNNTAPCIAYTALKLHNLNPEANFVVAPSDHIILKEITFLNKIKTALDFTEKNDALCTLGISPTRPDTGYGYIKFEPKKDKTAPIYDPFPTQNIKPVIKHDSSDDIKKVIEFKEKPNSVTAQEYVNSGEYLWNAGIFVWKAKSVLKAFKTHANDIFELLSQGNNVYNTPSEQSFIDVTYPKSRNISVDFAIMENATNVYTLPADIGWSDLGTWGSLHAESPKDNAGNVVQATDHSFQDVKNCLIRLPKNKIAVVRSLENFIVVDEDDVLLIYPKANEQEIKQVRGGLDEKYI